MNPAKDKRKRLFQAFNNSNNKQNINNNNIQISHIKSFSKLSFLSPTNSRSSSIVSDLHEDKTIKLQTEMFKLKQENQVYKNKVEYHDKMECFYLSELKSLRQVQDRLRKKIDILLQELPSYQQRNHLEHHLCTGCHKLQQENISLRNEIDLKNKVIGILESDLDYKSIEAQVLKRQEQQSLWRHDTQEKQDLNTLSRLTKQSSQL